MQDVSNIFHIIIRLQPDRWSQLLLFISYPSTFVSGYLPAHLRTHKKTHIGSGYAMEFDCQSSDMFENKKTASFEAAQINPTGLLLPLHRLSGNQHIDWASI